MLGSWIKNPEKKRLNHNSIFLKQFICDNNTKGIIKITADSRYVLYFNETYIGYGPARNFENEYFIDTYEVDIIKGINLISVIHIDYGISTCQYIKNDPGIIFELKYNNNFLISDEKTKVRTIKSIPDNLYRINLAQGFVEEFNANDQTLFDYISI